MRRKKKKKKKKTDKTEKKTHIYVCRRMLTNLLSRKATRFALIKKKKGREEETDKGGKKKEQLTHASRLDLRGRSLHLVFSGLYEKENNTRQEKKSLSGSKSKNVSVFFLQESEHKNAGGTSYLHKRKTFALFFTA